MLGTGEDRDIEKGYDVHEDKRSFEKQGITGRITQYNTEANLYPQFCIMTTKENTMSMFQSLALKGMFETTTITDNILMEEDRNMGIYVYINVDDKKLRLGKIQPRQVKAFLKLFEANTIMGYLNEETLLEGDMLYVLSD